MMMYSIDKIDKEFLSYFLILLWRWNVLLTKIFLFFFFHAFPLDLGIPLVISDNLGDDGGDRNNDTFNNPHGNNGTLINSGDGDHDNTVARRTDGDHNAWYTVVTVTTMTR